jgi:iron complex outermembrane receptor protein
LRRIGSITSAIALLCLVTVSVDARDRQPDERVATLKRLSVEELMELDITSVSKRSERFIDAPAAVSVLTAEDIRRSGLSSLPDILRLADSMMVARFNGASWAISTRGFTSTANNKLLVLIDGRSVYTQLFGGVFWETQDYFIADIERIEVIRGPAGTLWGPNAVNGVINIITKSASDTQGGLFRTEAATRGSVAGAFRYGSRVGERTVYRVFAKSGQFGSPQLRSGASAHEDRTSNQAGFRVDVGPESGRATVQGDLMTGRFGLSDRPDADYWNGNVQIAWHRELNPGSRAGVLAYVDSGHRQVPRQSWNTRTIYNVEGQHDLQVGPRHRVIWGGGFRATYDRTRPQQVLFFEPDNRSIFQGHVFGQDEIAVRPTNVFLTVGARIERTTFSGIEAQPSVRLRYTNPSFTLWGAVSRAVRTPTRFDQDLRVRVGQLLIIRGDRAFTSEDLFAYESGVRLQPHTRVSLEATGFVHDYARLRSEEPTPPSGFPLVLENLYQGTTSGVEVAANVQPQTRWLIHASYTAQRIDLRPGPSSRDITDAISEAEDPEHMFAVRSYLDLPAALEFDTFFRAVGALRSGRTPAYREVDVRLGWQPRQHITLSLTGRDLLHARHTEFTGGASEPRFFQREAVGRVIWMF